MYGRRLIQGLQTTQVLDSKQCSRMSDYATASVEVARSTALAMTRKPIIGNHSRVIESMDYGFLSRP